MSAQLKEQRLFRLAPTPSGYLHWGNVFSFLWTLQRASDCNAKILLRIDDFDSSRTKKEYLENIFNVLEFLEVHWQLGPKNVDEAESASFSQALRMPELIQEFWDLIDGVDRSDRREGLTYVCECSKAKLKSRVDGGGEDVSLYDGYCRDRGLVYAAGRGVRLKSREPKRGAGDAWILRRDGVLAYQWISLVEDIRWNVTDVVRGMDLKDSTHFQLELAQALSQMGHAQFDAFSSVKFEHHPLLKDSSRVKLSKNRKDLSFLDDVKKRGLKREDVWGNFCEWKEKAI